MPLPCRRLCLLSTPGRLLSTTVRFTRDWHHMVSHKGYSSPPFVVQVLTSASVQGITEMRAKAGGKQEQNVNLELERDAKEGGWENVEQGEGEEDEYVVL